MHATHVAYSHRFTEPLAGNVWLVSMNRRARRPFRRYPFRHRDSLLWFKAPDASSPATGNVTLSQSGIRGQFFVTGRRGTHNLAYGWVGFDFTSAFERPVKMMNDAAMQALGSYNGGSMLFLGLGTGPGSAMIVDGIIEPMELAHVPYRKRTYEYHVGQGGLEPAGKKRWRGYIADVVARLVDALEPEDVVLGGSNAKHVKDLPPGCRLGDNANAFLGGFRLWENVAGQRQAKGATRYRTRRK
jgi:hypothetical protein